MAGDIKRILEALSAGDVCKANDNAYLALGRGSATSFFGFDPEDIYCFSKAGRGAMAGSPLQDKADRRGCGAIPREGRKLEFARDTSRGYILIEALILLPQVHCFQCVHLNRLRCIERHLDL